MSLNHTPTVTREALPGLTRVRVGRWTANSLARLVADGTATKIDGRTSYVTGRPLCGQKGRRSALTLAESWTAPCARCAAKAAKA